MEEVGTSIQAGPGSLGGTKPAVAVSPTREEGSPMVLGSSPVLPMSVPAILRAKAVARSPSRIRSCDDATTEKVVLQYTKDSLFPSEHDNEGYWFCYKPWCCSH